MLENQPIQLKSHLNIAFEKEMSIFCNESYVLEIKEVIKAQKK